MYRLDTSCVVEWVGQGADYRPATFDTVCPHCHRQVNFRVVDAVADPNRGVNGATGTCSRCHQSVFVWTIGEGTELYMRPAPIARQPVDGKEHMDEAAQRAYQSALNVFNAGEWDATAVATRVTLEGIVHNLLSEEEYNAREALARQLRKLAESKTEDLARPIVTLSNVLREGGNIGAHFDLRRTTDREMARAMLDLLDYLIEYVYALPRRIEETSNRIRAFDPDEGEDVTEG